MGFFKGLNPKIVILLVILVPTIIIGGYFEFVDEDTKMTMNTNMITTEETAQKNKEVESKKENLTMGQINALAHAKTYLNTMAFSYTGLISQLEYEGYSKEEATYGVDNCGADWNEQAAKKAKEYINTMSFSRSGLIEQLKYEGFTADQAEYGVTAIGY